MEFKDRIKQLREDKRLNLTQLAVAFDLKESGVRSWENGRTKPGADTLIKLADYFGVTTDYLLGRTNTKKPEYEAVASDLGLDDKAIANIKICHERGWSVSDFISNTFFRSLVLNYTAYKHIDDLEYLDKKLGRTFDSIITDRQRRLFIRAEIDDCINFILGNELKVPVKVAEWISDVTEDGDSNAST